MKEKSKRSWISTISMPSLIPSGKQEDDRSDSEESDADASNSGTNMEEQEGSQP
jgi:hypothetical protein